MNKLYSLTVLYDLYYLPKWNKVIVIVKKLKLYRMQLRKKNIIFSRGVDFSKGARGLKW